jgi:hypothetical protein
MPASTKLSRKVPHCYLPAGGYTQHVWNDISFVSDQLR